MATIKGNLIKETKITLDGNVGRDLEYSLSASDGTPFLGRTRIYVVGKAFYSLSMVRVKDLDQADASRIEQKYISSIKLTPAK